MVTAQYVQFQLKALRTQLQLLQLLQLLQHFTNFLELWPSCGEENEVPGHRRIATAIAANAIRGDLQLSRCNFHARELHHWRNILPPPWHYFI